MGVGPEALSTDHGRTEPAKQVDQPVDPGAPARMQPYGPGRELRRLIWIRPFLRGPDLEESLQIRASRVQPGQPRRG